MSPMLANPISAGSPLEAVARANARYDYLLGLPHGYATRPADRWPLLLFLHGALERGAELWNVARHGPPKLLLGAAGLSPAEGAVAHTIRETFIVVAPQCAHFEVWDDAALLDLIDHLVADHRVDRARIYVSGMSMGGFGVWSLAMRHPHRFAAIAPICGGGRVADIARTGRERAAELRRLGIWAFHGARDRVVPLEESERMVEAARRHGVAEARLTVYPEVEHDAWTATYANPDVYAWLLRHTAPSA